MDLSQYQVIQVSPDTGGIEFGFQFGSVLSGITWESLSALELMFSPVILAVQVAGSFGAPASTLTQFFNGQMTEWDNVPIPCSYLLPVNGLGVASFSGSRTSSSISGNVVIAGFSGLSVPLSIPIPGAIVALVTGVTYRDNLADECNLDQLVTTQLTMTDGDGAFTFNGLNNGQVYQIAVLDDGFFRQTMRSPSLFLQASPNSVNIFSPLGCPLNVTAASSGVTIDYYVNSQTAPSYQRSASDTGFEGDSLPVNVWAWCVNNPGACTAMSRHQLKVASISGRYVIDSNCFDSLAFNSSYSHLQHSLLAATYNVASGRGIFQPYDTVQAWFLKFAETVVCPPASVTPDAASVSLAQTLLNYINSATDLDRY